MDPDQAFAEAIDRLSPSIAARLGSNGGAWLGLTAGLDSQAIAAAMSAGDTHYDTFTWSHAPADVAGAVRAAAHLGVAHRSLEPAWRGDSSDDLAPRARERVTLDRRAQSLRSRFRRCSVFTLAELTVQDAEDDLLDLDPLQLGPGTPASDALAIERRSGP